MSEAATDALKDAPASAPHADGWTASERIVVAVSERGDGPALVHAAHRLAEALRAPWTAVYIETPRAARLPVADGAQVAETLHLAAQLGGQVASVPAQTVAAGLRRFCADARATHLVVGKAATRRWRGLRQGSAVDALLRGAQGAMAVHLVPLAAPPQPRARRGGRRATDDGAAGPWGTGGGYVASLGLTLAVTLAGALIGAGGNVTDLGLIYMIPVLLAATRYGLRTAIATGLACSLAYNFFFIPPTHTLTIEDPRNIITVLVLLGVAIVASQLAARVRDHALLAEASARRSNAQAGFARLLTAISRPEELAQVLCAEIGRIFDGNAVLLLPGAGAQGGELAVRASWPGAVSLEMLDMAAAGWAFEHGEATGRGGATLTASEWLFQPIAAGGACLGVFGLARTDAQVPVRTDQLPLLLSLLDQGGLALERIALEAQMAELSQVEERDRLRQALLSSVSHDLRTPLTTMLGSLAELRVEGAAQAGLLAQARGAAERLHRFVGNLLDMARIEAGALDGTIEPVDLAEAVAAVLHDLRGVLADCRVETRIALDTPMVMVDPRLFQHCLLNLVENAVKHGDPGPAPREIGILARRTPGGLGLDVTDNGPGIPAGQEARIFGTFTRIEGSDRKGGSGLGLAIVKGFAGAMGLSVSAANREDARGARFSVQFDADHLKEWPEE